MRSCGWPVYFWLRGHCGLLPPREKEPCFDEAHGRIHLDSESFRPVRNMGLEQVRAGVNVARAHATPGNLNTLFLQQADNVAFDDGEKEPVSALAAQVASDIRLGTRKPCSDLQGTAFSQAGGHGYPGTVDGFQPNLEYP